MRLPASLSPGAPFLLWPPVMATLGAGEQSARHSHHALHLVVARAGRLRVRWRVGRAETPAVLTAPDVEHAIDARGLEVALVFVEPESDAGARLMGALDGPVRTFDDALGLPPPGKPVALGAWTEAVTARVGGPAPARAVHPRVRRVLRLLRGGGEVDASLAALARAAGLSEGRFVHVFTESVGIPLRRYLLWLKLQRAATLLVTGEALTAAAGAAGFSDAAHMARTFRRMFGVRPSALRAAASSFKTGAA